MTAQQACNQKSFTMLRTIGRIGALAIAGGVGVASIQIHRTPSTHFGQRSDDEPEERIFDALVIGGGVVGLAVARDIAVRGHSVCVVEREDAFAASASSGNSGLGCTGYARPKFAEHYF